MAGPRDGFTLVEVAIVVLILGILAAVAAPRFAASLEYFRVDAAAKRVAADLEAARRAARSAGANRTVQFDVAQNQYTLVGVKDLNHPTVDATTRLAKTGYPATLSSASFNGVAELTFDLYGRPLAGSPPAPLAAGSVVVQAGSRQRTIVVDPATGAAQIQ